MIKVPVSDMMNCGDQCECVYVVVVLFFVLDQYIYIQFLIRVLHDDASFTMISHRTL